MILYFTIEKGDAVLCLLKQTQKNPTVTSPDPVVIICLAVQGRHPLIWEIPHAMGQLTRAPLCPQTSTAELGCAQSSEVQNKEKLP